MPAEEIVAVWVGDHHAYFKSEVSDEGLAGYEQGSLFRRAERFTRGGMHCDIDYVRIFKVDGNEIEFCLHQIQGVESRYPDGVVEGESGG